jgi:hypothetical protein
MSSSALGPLLPPVQWVPGYSWEESSRGMALTTPSHLVPRLRMGGAIPLLRLYVYLAWTGEN